MTWKPPPQWVRGPSWLGTAEAGRQDVCRRPSRSPDGLKLLVLELGLWCRSLNPGAECAPDMVSLLSHLQGQGVPAVALSVPLPRLGGPEDTEFTSLPCMRPGQPWTRALARPFVWESLSQVP